jgi:hypothetical protein
MNNIALCNYRIDKSTHHQTRCSYTDLLRVLDRSKIIPQQIERFTILLPVGHAYQLDFQTTSKAITRFLMSS